MIGSILDDRYRVIRLLGKGGMGEVYLVEHIELGRKEAMKVLAPALQADTMFVRRFRREARATNRVQHPNIVRVHNFGQLPDERFFLTMEYVEGTRLDHRLGGGPLDVPTTLLILRQLAAAIDHAHSQHVIHRDLKPSNLLLTSDGPGGVGLKVLDFGISKIVAPDYHESAQLSKDGEAFGTAEYMSPEQFKGVGDEPRSDIYAAGCIGYAMLTGKAPFAAKTMVSAMMKHMSAPRVPPSQVANRDDIPRELDDILVRCIAVKPDDRFATGGALARALGHVPQAAATTGSAAIPVNIAEAPTGVMQVEQAQTQKLSTDTARIAYTEALLGLGDAVISAGHKSATLAVLVDEVRLRKAELERITAESAAVEQRRDAVNDELRDREPPLRFAAGELHKQRAAKAGAGESTADLDYQIAELELRLTNLLSERDRHLVDIDTRAEQLAADAAQAHQNLATSSAKLESQLAEVLPRIDDDATVESHRGWLETARSAMRHADGDGS